jgi:hypothetical protein
MIPCRLHLQLAHAYTASSRNGMCTNTEAQQGGAQHRAQEGFAAYYQYLAVCMSHCQDPQLLKHHHAAHCALGAAFGRAHQQHGTQRVVGCVPHDDGTVGVSRDELALTADAWSACRAPSSSEHSARLNVQHNRKLVMSCHSLHAHLVPASCSSHMCSTQPSQRSHKAHIHNSGLAQHSKPISAISYSPATCVILCRMATWPVAHLPPRC